MRLWERVTHPIVSVAIKDSTLHINYNASSIVLLGRSILRTLKRSRHSHFVLACTLHNIETLLIHVKFPISQNNVAHLLAKGYEIVLARDGFVAARKWKEKTIIKMQKHYTNIDALVKQHYIDHPEDVRTVPERFWGKTPPVRNVTGYDPAYAPDEQGLPSFEDSMIKSGLVKEYRRKVAQAWLFDIDGPITDPFAKKVIHDDVIASIITLLSKGEPVCLNTGRSLSWASEKVVDALENLTQDKTNLQNLSVIGEKGGTWFTYDKNGRRDVGKSLFLSIPKQLYNEVQEIIQEHFSDSMSMYESGRASPTKSTMITVEMIAGYDYAIYKEKQKKLANTLRSLVKKKYESKYSVDCTTVGTDVESPYVGKNLGAQRFLQWLRDEGITPSRFVAFGDSISDIDMAEELLRKGKEVTFVYVGESAKLTEAKNAGSIKDTLSIVSPGNYSAGTLQYLREFTNDARSGRK